MPSHSAKSDPDLKIWTFQLKDKAVEQPVIRFLQLITLIDQLAKHAIFITDPIACDGQLECCATINKAGRKASKAAIPKPRIRFNLNEFLKDQSQILESDDRSVYQTQIEHGITEGSTHQEFE